jgi:hypothetical protein
MHISKSPSTLRLVITFGAACALTVHGRQRERAFIPHASHETRKRLRVRDRPRRGVQCALYGPTELVLSCSRGAKRLALTRIS